MSRFDYVMFDKEHMELCQVAKAGVTAIEEFIDNLDDGRAKSLAHTKLEECFMWIGKAIRDRQLKGND